ncbi:hypothetical protein AXF42_Ash003076 [Apostasia shenzhenica]|uniref:Uncharacterized protein n=1 Tax=Apostasia shenzhenica TaxID=1088818 RepID=A0A2I0A834_9ASPA|nr:hypothetical protein AXF42_Ash003076 [Apostasia shenzhenica]
MAVPPEKVVESVCEGLSARSIGKDVLVKLLKTAEDALSELSPCSSLQPSLTSLSCSFLQHELLKHKDKDVKVLVAVCFTEIIRLLAPNPPFSYEVFKDIFGLIVSVFKNLSDTNSPHATRRLKILETVAYCKSLLGMLVTCEDLTVELFEVFFRAVTYKLQKSLLQAILAIMTNIVEQEVTPRILSPILHNLLKGEKDASCRLAVSVIQDCVSTLETSVCSFLAYCMLDKNAGDKSRVTNWESGGCDSDDGGGILVKHVYGNELRCSYHGIILKIYQYAPQILTSVLPILTRELLNDQVDTRLKAVHLIGNLLVISKLKFAQQHPPVFAEFLRRFSDKSTEVRRASLEWAKVCFVADASASDALYILNAVEGRLLDFDDKVRIQAVAIVCNIASSTISCFPSDLVLKTMKRLRDKKISVRKSAMQSLLELYRIYCLKCSSGLFSLSDNYENIPCGVLLLCFDKDNKEFRSQNLELILARDLFPSSLLISERKKHWIALFSLFTQPHLKALESILIQKRRFQLEMQDYFALRDSEKENVSDEVPRKISESFSKMATSFLDSSQANECFHRLHRIKDHNIFKSLQQLLDERTTFASANHTRVSLLGRIGKKHPDYDFYKILSFKCSYTIFHAELVRSILEDCLSVESKNDEYVRCSFELVLFIVKLFPCLLGGSEDLLLKLLDTTCLTKEKLLHVLAMSGHVVSIDFRNIRPLLEKLCLEGTRAESKFAVLAISSLVGSSDDLTFSNLCKKLVRSLQGGQNIPTILQSLSFIGQCSFSSYKPCEEQVTNFIIQKIFRSEMQCSLEETSVDSVHNSSLCCKLKIYGMKALVKSYLSNQKSHDRHQIQDLLEILRLTVQGEGIVYTKISREMDRDCLRLSAVKLLLRFATRYDSYISPKLFHLICAMARDSSCVARKTFLFKIHEHLSENLIPIRYACAFALASTDCIGDIRIDSMKYLSEFIKGHHRIHSASHQNPSSGDENVEVINYPEYVVVFLIHLLAHDKAFPSLEDKDSYPEFCSPLAIMLRALVDVNVYDGNNSAVSDTLSNLLVILRAIMKADDATDAQVSPKLHVLASIALLISKSLGQSFTYFPNTRRAVLLPSTFYKVRRDPICKGHDATESFINDNFVKGVLDVLDSSIVKPCPSNSKQYNSSHEGGYNCMGIMKGHMDNPQQAKRFKPLLSESKSQRTVDFNDRNVYDKESRQEKNLSIRPFKTCSLVASDIVHGKSSAQFFETCSLEACVSTDLDNINSGASDSQHVKHQISDADLATEQQSSCDSASTEIYLLGSQTLIADAEIEALNPLFQNGVTKYESGTCPSQKMSAHANSLISKKELVGISDGFADNQVCICSSTDMCSCSRTVDSHDFQQNIPKDTSGLLRRDCSFEDNVVLAESTSRIFSNVVGEPTANCKLSYDTSAAVHSFAAAASKTKGRSVAAASAQTKKTSKLSTANKDISNAARKTRQRRT